MSDLRTAIVTGGGSGIGLAIAVRFAETSFAATFSADGDREQRRRGLGAFLKISAETSEHT